MQELNMSEKLRLLCVDDETHILHTLGRFCRNEGIYMLRAATAAEGLAILEREPVAIVLSDYQMPGMHGLDFLREVRCCWPQTAGIILSGFIELPAVTQALQQGDIFGFLAKPWQRDKLKALIQAAADHYRTCSCSKGNRS